MQRFMMILAMLVLVVTTGCSASQKFQQVGGTAVSWTNFEIEFMRDTPMIEPIQCPISMAKQYKYLIEKEWEWYRVDKWFSKDKPDQFFWACQDPRMELKLQSWEPIRLVYAPSPFRTASPGVSNLVTGVAAAFTLGKTMPGTEISNNVNQNVPISASTAYTNAVTVPPWVGK